jgi:peptidoglycan hydrolase-like protein with peptidoglycan-binding domain
MLSYLNNNNKYNKDIFKAQVELSKLNLLNSKYINGYFNLETEKAIKEFQNKNNILSDGILDDKTYKKLVQKNIAKTNTNSGVYNRNLYTEKTVINDDSVRNEDAFFNDTKNSQLRKGTVDIKIKYAQTGETIIKDVKYRSVGRQINASGEAIYEAYEFIAKDIIE